MFALAAEVQSYIARLMKADMNSLEDARRKYKKRLKEMVKDYKLTSKNKYKAVISKDESGTFRSGLERSTYGIIKLREKTEGILLLDREHPVDFNLNGIKILRYIVDYRCQYADGEIFFIEAKGFAGMNGQDWKIKQNLWLAHGPAKLEIYTGTAARPELTKIITPVNYVKKN